MKIIGIDIDGVLNDHRTQFCYILKKLTGKKLNPESIVNIPVHQLENSNVSLIDEKFVFHDLAYWEDMPPSISDFSFLSDIKSRFKIYIFTNRAWPEQSFINSKEKLKKVWSNSNIINITEDWLKNKQIPYDKLFVEENNLDLNSLEDKQNRYQLAKNYELEIFVEDNPQNAEKLAKYCSKVFLVSQPYNNYWKFAHKNIIRIKDISEIAKHL